MDDVSVNTKEEGWIARNSHHINFAMALFCLLGWIMFTGMTCTLGWARHTDGEIASGEPIKTTFDGWYMCKKVEVK